MARGRLSLSIALGLSLSMFLGRPLCKIARAFTSMPPKPSPIVPVAGSTSPVEARMATPLIACW